MKERGVNILRNILIWFAIIGIMIFAFNFFEQRSQQSMRTPLNTFVQMVEEGKIREAVVKGQRITAVTTDGQRIETAIPVGSDDVVNKMIDKGVTVSVEPVDGGNGWLFSLLLSWLPILLFIGIWIAMMRQMSGGSGPTRAFSFGKSKAKVYVDDKPSITLKDVAGIDEVKEEVKEIIDYLKDPARFHKVGGRPPKGVLLYGEPGVGKTLLAKAIAGEAHVPFISASGSDFVEMFVGVGAARVRDLFETAKKNAPCIIFIDEIDAVGRSRGAINLGGGNDEREQTLNQLLV